MQKINKENKPKPSVKCGVFNFSSESSLGLPSIRMGSSYKGARFLPFSGISARYNTDNIYPQLLAGFACDSPTNGTAINRKAMMIKGEGFDYTTINNKNFVKWMESINQEGESANDILEKVGVDYAMFGGFAMKVQWGNDGFIKYVEHVPFEQIRCGIPNEFNKIEYYVVNNNWDRSLSASYERTEVIPSFNPELFGKSSIQLNELGIPVPTDMQLENATQLIYYFDKKPAATSGMMYYPVPPYIACLDAIGTEIEINISNKSLLDSSFGAKTIIAFPFVPTDDKDFAETDSNVKRSFTSARNNGGVVTLYGDTPDRIPTISQVEALKADTYIELDKNVKQSIITAHNIPAILLEYNYGGGFNNRAEEMVVAYNQYQATVIKSFQQKIVGVFNKLAIHKDYPELVGKIQITPFSLEVSVTKDTTATTNNNNISSQATTSISGN
jgi:hypothetical protein